LEEGPFRRKNKKIEVQTKKNLKQRKSLTVQTEGKLRGSGGKRGGSTTEKITRRKNQGRNQNSVKSFAMGGVQKRESKLGGGNRKKFVSGRIRVKGGGVVGWRWSAWRKGAMMKV